MMIATVISVTMEIAEAVAMTVAEAEVTTVVVVTVEVTAVAMEEETEAETVEEMTMIAEEAAVAPLEGLILASLVDTRVRLVAAESTTYSSPRPLLSLTTS